MTEQEIIQKLRIMVSDNYKRLLDDVTLNGGPAEMCIIAVAPFEETDILQEIRKALKVPETLACVTAIPKQAGYHLMNTFNIDPERLEGFKLDTTSLWSIMLFEHDHTPHIIVTILVEKEK